MKKILAIIMTICLMATLLCVSTFAADNEPAANIVLRVSALKIDGSPNDPPVVIKDYDNFQDGWNYAMELAGDEDVMKEKKYGRIIVDLYADWKANADGEFTEEIWNGDGFDNDTICIPGDAKVTLNMNGHTINRGLTWGEDDGEVIYISSDADVVINNGTIRGGRSDNGAGGIHIKSDANVTLNNVNIVSNLASSDGGGIYVGSDSSLVMNGGSFIDNNVYNMSPTDYGYGGAVCVDNATAVFKGVEFRNNHAGFPFAFGAAISADDSDVTIEDCVFDENGLYNYEEEIRSATSIIHAVDSTIKVKGSSFTNNGEYFTNAHVDYSSTFIVDDSELTIEACEFSNNGSDFIIADKDDSYVSVSNTKFVDNKSAVMRGDSDTSTDSFFDKCTFNNNVNHSGDESFYNITTDLKFYNCSMGDSTFSDKTHIKFFSDVSESYVNLSVSVLKTDGTTVKIEDYVSFETGWNAAIDLAKKKAWLQANDVDRVVIDLYADWTAVDDEFGSGSGFDWSTIFIPGDTKITLNMNGHTIDRNLQTDDYDGEVIHVDEEADLIINGGKSGDPIIMPGQPAGDVKMGTITGGWSCNGAGGIFIDNYAKVELNNVNVVGNKVRYDDGAGIGVYAGATLVMNGGSVSDNVVKVGFSLDGTFYGGGVLVENATATLNGVTLANNINVRLVSSLKGSAIASKNSATTLKNCLIKDNGQVIEYIDEESDTDPDASVEKTDSTDSIVFALGGTMVIENTEFVGNGTKDVWAVRETDHVTSLFHIESADLTMTGGKVTGNNQVFLFIICCGEANVSGVDFTGNESLAMYRDGEYCSKPASTFTDCKFSAGTPYDEYTYDFQFGNKNANVTFVDCDFGEATFDNKSAAKFENTKNGVGSILGEGSLTNILVIISLVASGVSISLTLYYNKKKTVPAASDGEAETENEE